MFRLGALWSLHKATVGGVCDLTLQARGSRCI